MKMKKLWIIAFLAFVLTLSGCGSLEKDQASENTESQKSVRIGISFDTFVVERWQRDRDVFVSTAVELGAEVNVQNANGNVAEQVSQLSYFIEKKMDVIVVVPIESDALVEVIEKARNAGIKVIAYDRIVKNANIDLYVSFDNEDVGTLMGKAVTRKLAKGDSVLMICGSKTDNNVLFVESGFEKELRTKGIVVADKVYTDGWKAELAAEYVGNNMDKVRQAKAIMCGNDDIAGQVIRVLSENRMAGDVLVIGQDADLEACQRIVAGTQYMTVFKPVEKLAKCTAEAAVALAKGETVVAEDSIDNGKVQVPYLKLEPLAVTKENMDAVIIDSGFHLKDDVYINLPRGN